MATVKKYEYRVPRSFRLRQELEFAEKGASMESKSGNQVNKPRDPHQGFVSFGLGEVIDSSAYDKQLSNWNGTIIGPQNTVLGDRIYTMRIKCGPNYPDEPPLIYFDQKILMQGVDPNTGLVHLPTIMKSWNRNNNMYDFLVAIRQAMANAAKTKQPGPDERFPNTPFPAAWC